MIDMTGQKFGLLTAVRPMGKGKDGSFLWQVICKCNLENPIIVNGGDLRRGRKKSCGCLHGNRAELLGKTFGYLVVVGYQYSESTNIFLWECLCECGDITLAKAADLTSGSKKSCGCLKSPNLVGGKFGKLTVIEKLNEKRYGYHLWKVQCDCGTYDVAITSHLKSGNKKSCGCLVESIEDIRGLKRNLLTVEEVADFRSPKGEILWKFKCDCGNFTYVTRDKFMSSHTKSCGCLKDLSLEKHPNWKNGVTPISKLLRRNLEKWKQKSLQATDYKCYITNEYGKLVIHHANEKHPFHMIVQETFKITGLSVHLTISYYSAEEIELLIEVCLKLHFKYGLGIPLKKELHAEFHQTYGFLDWSNKDFEEFVNKKRALHAARG